MHEIAFKNIRTTSEEKKKKEAYQWIGLKCSRIQSYDIHMQGTNNFSALVN